MRVPPLAVGLGIYLPTQSTLMIVVGAIAGWLFDRRADRTAKPEATKQLGVLLASGLIVGEGIIGVVISAIIVFSGKDAPLALVGPGLRDSLAKSSAVLLSRHCDRAVSLDPADGNGKSQHETEMELADLDWLRCRCREDCSPTRSSPNFQSRAIFRGRIFCSLELARVVDRRLVPRLWSTASLSGKDFWSIFAQLLCLLSRFSVT